MKFFLDTANLADIKSVMNLGIVKGITTNPSIISREMQGAGFSVADHYTEIASLAGTLPVSVEVLSTQSCEMVAEAEELAGISENIVVKIPCTVEGISAISQLSAKGISTNCTLIFSLTQALCAMNAGASFISPFIGRLEDVQQNGLELVADIVVARDRYTFGTEIICTSIRSLNHISQCIKLGADIVTCTPDYFYKLIEHPLTDAGLSMFLKDYNNAKQ